MATLVHSTSVSTYSTTTNWLTAYNQYADKADFNRIGWAATAVAIQGCILSPVLLLVMAYTGGGDWQFLASMFGFLLVLVPILDALPVKYIFPTFAASLLLHLLVILIDIL